MLVLNGKHREDLYPGRLEMVYKNQLLVANNWFKTNHNVAVLYINYSEAIDKPRETAEKVQRFLGVTMDIEKMVSVVDKSLYRQKS
jgi:hypothetical protein